MQESKFLKDNLKNIEKLMGIPALRGFDTNKLGNLLTISKIRQYSDGECILAEGQPDPWLYFLLSGAVRVTRKGELVARLTEQGEVFGEMGLLGRSDKSASAHACGDTVCLSTDSTMIENMVDDDKLKFFCILYKILAEVLTARLKTTTDELVAAKKEIASLKKKGVA